MPPTKVRVVAIRATSLWSCSSPFGIAIITTTPTRGTNVMTARPQWWRKVFIASSSPLALSDDQHENAGQDGGCGEEQRRILLHSAGLDLAEARTGFVGDHRRAV